MTVKVARGRLGLNSLSMKSPYSGRIVMWSVASGAGAYSHDAFPRAARPHDAGAGLVSGFLVSVPLRLWHRAFGLTAGGRLRSMHAWHPSRGLPSHGWRSSGP